MNEYMKLTDTYFTLLPYLFLKLKEVEALPKSNKKKIKKNMYVKKKYHKSLIKKHQIKTRSKMCTHP